MVREAADERGPRMPTSMEQFSPWLRDLNRLPGLESGAVAGVVPLVR
jgi:hypothetical protein